MQFRIGQGFDSHSLKKGTPLILGGVSIPYEFGLKGHSDGDVLTHAVIDSILGALSIGNIGQWFPSSDPSFKNFNSIKLLEKILYSEEFKDWKLGNLDATVIAESPNLSSYIHKIRTKYSEVFASPINCISIKPKSADGLGFCGRKEGIAALTNLILQY